MKQLSKKGKWVAKTYCAQNRSACRAPRTCTAGRRPAWIVQGHDMTTNVQYRPCTGYLQLQALHNQPTAATHHHSSSRCRGARIIVCSNICGCHLGAKQLRYADRDGPAGTLKPESQVQQRQAHEQVGTPIGKQFHKQADCGRGRRVG